ncbi:MAG: ASCH domain-containing protein [Crinalium sp.]
MKAITLHQPWASLIILNLKQFETRNWATNHRGELAIHVAKRPIKPAEIDAVVNLISDAKTIEVIKNYDYPFGCVVATCNLIDCITMTPEFIASQSLTERTTGGLVRG